MSATKSNMPRGTRLAAFTALALAVCLLAWRGNTLLTSTSADQGALTHEQRQLTLLLEPVLGRDTFRLAVHHETGGAKSFLILVDASDAAFHLDPAATDRIASILTAAAGYQADRDALQIQPFAFAAGTAGDIEQSALAELGGLTTLCFLLGWLAFTLGRDQRQEADRPAATPPPFDLPQSSPVLRPVPMQGTVADNDAMAEARKLARDNPRELAQILRRWMQGGSDPA